MKGRGENGDCSRSLVRTVSTGCETPQCAASWMLLLYARDSSRWLLTPGPHFLSRGAQTFWHRARAYSPIKLCLVWKWIRGEMKWTKFLLTRSGSSFKIKLIHSFLTLGSEGRQCKHCFPQRGTAQHLLSSKQSLSFVSPLGLLLLLFTLCLNWWAGLNRQWCRSRRWWSSAEAMFSHTITS